MQIRRFLLSRDYDSFLRLEQSRKSCDVVIEPQSLGVYKEAGCGLMGQNVGF